jgi:hypothetical protein
MYPICKHEKVDKPTSSIEKAIAARDTLGISQKFQFFAKRCYLPLLFRGSSGFQKRYFTEIIELAGITPDRFALSQVMVRTPDQIALFDETL